MNFGNFTTDYNGKTQFVSFSPKTGGSYLFEMSSFGFGLHNTTNSSEYYESILNFDTDLTVYGTFQNTS